MIRKKQSGNLDKSKIGVFYYDCRLKIVFHVIFSEWKLPMMFFMLVTLFPKAATFRFRFAGIVI